MLIHELLFNSMDLDNIAIKNGTDKNSNGNGYTFAYEFYFNKIRNKQVKILELGIYHGASLKMWEEHFPNAKIYGVDLLPECKKYETERIFILIKNLDNQSSYEEIKKYGPFDIIIDDASHRYPQLQCNLESLFSSLNDGGVYIIEDLHTSYFKSFNMGYKSSTSMIETLKNKIDSLNVDTYKKTSNSERFSCLDPEYINQPVNQFDKNLYSIHFYEGICFLFKGKR